MRTAIALVTLAALAACGGGEPPPQAPEPAARAEERPAARRAPLTMKAELGSVDPDAVKRVFSSLSGRFMDCQKRGLDRVEVLSGAVKFFLRIAEDGTAKWAYLEESDLGDRDTEKCLVDVVTGARWPKPDGGEAEARYDMELPLQSTRPANDWSADKVARVLGAHGNAIDRCKAGAGARFRATMYVGPGGKVLAAGVAASGRDVDEAEDCLVKVLLTMKGLPSPGSWPAKVSFGL